MEAMLWRAWEWVRLLLFSFLVFAGYMAGGYWGGWQSAAAAVGLVLSVYKLTRKAGG